MRTRQRFRAAVAALPLLLAVAGCESGAEKADGPGSDGATPTASASRLSVFDVPVQKQPAAAGSVLADSGTARFTTTVTYTTAGGRAVERTTGVLDWRKDAARAERVRQVPAGFPAAVADDLGLTPGLTERHRFAVEGNEVGYLPEGGTWLRYAASDPKEFADAAGGLLDHAGDAAPWGRTLAEVLKVSFALDDEALPGGGRRYRTQVDGLTARSALPSAVAGRVDGQGPTQSVVVDLDRQGRLVRAEADFGKLLAELHGGGGLTGLTGLRVELALTGHGGPVTALVPATERFEAAKSVLTAIGEVKPGACASTDTGLGHAGLVRVVPCGGDADLRVFGQQRIDETVRNADPEGLGDRFAADRCRDDLRAAPAAWTAGARPAGTFRVFGGEKLGYGYTGPDASVRGDFTCYVKLR
ncbi:hypothetical protein ACF1CG_25600 [Streptomyces sp. NPDC014773]|uniref:hypothetical protein n=1 Tax=Streptomyces sp. NPDC014773 TaxID=3364908 RepID=UPI00370246CC